MARNRFFTGKRLVILGTPASCHLERTCDSRHRNEMKRLQVLLNQVPISIYGSYLNWIALLQAFGRKTGSRWAMVSAPLPWKELSLLPVRGCRLFSFAPSAWD